MANVVNEGVQKRIDQYVRVRDRIKEIKDQHDKELAPLLEVQNILSGWLQKFLDTAGCDSVKTEHGTCYKTTRYTASVADAEAFMAYVIANQQFDLMDRRANSTAVRDFAEANGTLPPGVNLSSISTVGVRRASGKD